MNSITRMPADSGNVNAIATPAKPDNNRYTPNSVDATKIDVPGHARIRPPRTADNAPQTIANFQSLLSSRVSMMLLTFPTSECQQRHRFTPHQYMVDQLSCGVAVGADTTRPPPMSRRTPSRPLRSTRMPWPTERATLLLERSLWPTLTLVVSQEAILLSTLVMIGQNRQAAFQQAKADHDFEAQQLGRKTNTELTRQIQVLTQALHRRPVPPPSGHQNPTQ